MDETITLNTKVSYKKRRNPRAFKLWDSAYLSAVMVHAAEVQGKIIEASQKAEKPIEELGHTNIDTKLLHIIVEGYLDLYSKMLAEGLIKTGNIKLNPNIH